MSKPSITVVVGPTSSGKTEHAIELAKKQSGSVVSADSRQVYAGMNIGVAKPQEVWSDDAHDAYVPDIVDGVAHYLLNVSTPDKPLSLADWQPRSFEVIDKVLDDGGHPILCGGTMLYVDSVAFNYSIPNVEADETLRSSLNEKDVEELYQELLQKDPEASSFVEPHHKQRIIRALEVIQSTGKKFSDERTSRDPIYDVTWIGLFPGWDELETRLQERTEVMFEMGLLDEVKHLRDTYSPTLPLLQTMNYKEAGLVLDGQMTHDEAVKEMVRSQMKYARRQMSWWRRNAEIEWV